MLTYASRMRSSFRGNAKSSASGFKSDSEQVGAGRFARSLRPSSVRGRLDYLGEGEPSEQSEILDQAGRTAPAPSSPSPAGRAGPAPAPHASGPAPAAHPSAGPRRADPTGLIQILTPWHPGPSRYGFQLKFQCASTSGSVADLRAQAPHLRWGEIVTYSRNDFAHRITPANPTVLPTPPDGIPFDVANTTILGANLQQFKHARDTHWTPTSAVRAADFAPAGARALPAVMQSSQLYRYSRDGASWSRLAGAFTLRRTLSRNPKTDALRFTTNKVGIHSVTEGYKP